MAKLHSLNLPDYEQYTKHQPSCYINSQLEQTFNQYDYPTISP